MYHAGRTQYGPKTPAARAAKEAEIGKAALRRGLRIYRLTSGNNGWYAHMDNTANGYVGVSPNYLTRPTYDDLLAFFTDDLIFARHVYEQEDKAGILLRGALMNAEIERTRGLNDWVDCLRRAKLAEWDGDTERAAELLIEANVALLHAETARRGIPAAEQAVADFLAGGPHTQEEAATYLAALPRYGDPEPGVPS